MHPVMAGACALFLLVTAGCSRGGPAVPAVGGESMMLARLDLPDAPMAGESTLVGGPDGTLVLIDVGDELHDDEVRDAVRAYNEAFGGAREDLQVEWLVLTHFHRDHIGAAARLLKHRGEPLHVTKGIVHRGWVEIGGGANGLDAAELCSLIKGTALDKPLCNTEAAVDCSVVRRAEPMAAADCDGLMLGDLEDPNDDGDGLPTSIALGGGARIVFMAASGRVSDGVSVQRIDLGEGSLDVLTDNLNEENARSLAGIITHGGFSYFFAGDMTGSGAENEPDMETPVVEIAGRRWLGADGADVVHANHHARATSSNQAFVDALAPDDGRSRNVLGGIAPAHVASPHLEVLERWAGGKRLGEGRIFVTRRAPAGASHEALVEALGPVVVRTLESGTRYRIETSDGHYDFRPLR